MKDAQTLRIQRWFAQGKSLTPLSALRKFGCMRLGARVWDLRKAGWPIKSEMVRAGHSHVARYWIDVERVRM